MLGRKKKGTKEAIAAEVEDGRGNVVNAEHEGELDAEGGDDHYQDSDNANKPTDDSGEDDVEGDKKGKRKKTEKFPRYLGPCLDKCDLYVGMKLKDKKQLRQAFDNYRILKGYDLKITKSDTVRFQCHCFGEGCKWSMWASKCKNELSFQLTKIENPHNCIPFSFEQGSRCMSTSWLIKYYIETFRLQPVLRSRELKDLIEKDHNYKVSLSMCTNVRAGALKAIIVDYKA